MSMQESGTVTLLGVEHGVVRDRLPLIKPGIKYIIISV